MDRAPAADALALRRVALAVSVLDGVDLLPHDAGVLLPGVPATLVTWDELAAAVGRAEPQSPAARRSVVAWLLARRRLAEVDASAALRPLGMPRGAAPHPGRDWVECTVLGNALDLGLGLVGLDAAGSRAIQPVPPGALAAAGGDHSALWPAVRDRLEEAGALAAQGYVRRRGGVLRPFGDLDVLTLLGAASFRRALCADDPVGMRSIVVPMRTRGWLDAALVDAAFAPAAAAITEPADRGFAQPLLITPDEVVLGRDVDVTRTEVVLRLDDRIPLPR